jgi:hypothetical protein
VEVDPKQLAGVRLDDDQAVRSLGDDAVGVQAGAELDAPETSRACGVPPPAFTCAAVTRHRVGRSESVT